MDHRDGYLNVYVTWQGKFLLAGMHGRGSVGGSNNDLLCD